MKLTQKEVSNIIYDACKNWDINWMTRYFADEVAKEIRRRENKKWIKKRKN